MDIRNSFKHLINKNGTAMCQACLQDATEDVHGAVGIIKVALNFILDIEGYWGGNRHLDIISKYTWSL